MDSISFTEPEVPIYDYSQLVINEVNGAGTDPNKYIELYNKGTVALPMEGVKTYYTNAANGKVLNWEGTAANGTVAAGACF